MSLAAYLLLFVVVGVGFIFVHLVAGKLFRPNKPFAEKGTIYECGEPTIGSAWVQFDLRFYVVALLFVIFDVEVAFFFPWAEVFGRANAVAAVRTKPDKDKEKQALLDYGNNVAALIPQGAATEAVRRKYTEPEGLAGLSDADVTANAEAAHGLAVLALGEIVVFFGILLVGFAYLWKRGDLEWVRSLAERGGKPAEPAAVPLPPRAVKAATEPAVAAGAGH
jgi:NADH-quinone oxidoreductase subunit A